MDNNTLFDFKGVSRWSLAGWTFFFTFLGYICIDVIVSYTAGYPSPLRNTIVHFLKSLFGQINNGNSLEILILILSLSLAAGIPVGYLIYQGYFFLRWLSPFGSYGLLYPWLPGRFHDLREATMVWRMKRFPLSRLSSEVYRNMLSNPAAKLKRFTSWETFTLWDYVEILFHTRLGGNLLNRYQYLHEIQHSLGSSLFASEIAFLLYGFVKILTDFSKFHFTYPLITFALFMLLLYIVNTEYQRSKPFGWINEGSHIISFLYLFLLTLAILNLHPKIGPYLWALSSDPLPKNWNVLLQHLITIFTLSLFVGLIRNTAGFRWLLQNANYKTALFYQILIFVLPLGTLYLSSGFRKVNLQLDIGFLFASLCALYLTYILALNRYNARRSELLLMRLSLEQLAR